PSGPTHPGNRWAHRGHRLFWRSYHLHAAATLDRSLAAAVAAGAERPEYVGELPSAMFEAEIAVEQAQVTVLEDTVRVASELFLTGGASNTAVKKGLDRHWRNAQTVSTHNPIVFRARNIGRYYVNCTLPEGRNAIGDPKTGSSDEDSAEGSSATNQDRVATRRTPSARCLTTAQISPKRPRRVWGGEPKSACSLQPSPAPPSSGMTFTSTAQPQH